MSLDVWDSVTQAIRKSEEKFNQLKIEKGFLFLALFFKDQLELIITYNRLDMHSNTTIYTLKIKDISLPLMAFYKSIDTGSINFYFESYLPKETQDMLENVSAFFPKSIHQLPEVLNWATNVDPELLNQFYKQVLTVNNHTLRETIKFMQDSHNKTEVFSAKVLTIENKLNELLKLLYDDLYTVVLIKNEAVNNFQIEIKSKNGFPNPYEKGISNRGFIEFTENDFEFKYKDFITYFINYSKKDI